MQAAPAATEQPQLPRRASPVQPLVLPAPDATVARHAIESPGAARRLAMGIHLEREAEVTSSGDSIEAGCEGTRSRLGLQRPPLPVRQDCFPGDGVWTLGARKVTQTRPMVFIIDEVPLMPRRTIVASLSLSAGHDASRL